MKKEFSSFMEALNHLNKHQDYIAFNLKGHSLEHPVTKKKFPMEEVTFIKSFTFEDDSDAGNIILLHLIQVTPNINGFFIDASGMYADLVI